jgi:HD superfamily phosphohydrolase
MPDLYRHKIVIDPVHGDIGLSKLETRIINTPSFQRLRHLKQLGCACLVYPNASHSRFAHSLGVLKLTSDIIDVFRRNDKLDDDGQVQRLRLAALLHDIGHYPYSHLMELVDWDQYTAAFLKKKGDSSEGGLPVSRYPKHDDLAKLIITSRKDVSQLLASDSIDPQEIVALIHGEHTEIPNLLHKSLDVDRMDYLLRDSLNTGVPYGHVDLNYILNNLDVEGSDVVLRAKARFAAEHLLLARYFMFNTVYLHKTVFGFEEVIRRIILLLLQGNGGIYKSGEEIRQMVGADSEEFLDFHDGYIDALIDRYGRRDDGSPLGRLCRSVKLRKPPKLIHEVVDLRDPEKGQSSEEYNRFCWCMEDHLEDLARESGIDPKCLIWRQTKDVEFEALNPFTQISKALTATPEEIRELVRIKDSSGAIVNLIEDRKSIVHYLSQLSLKVVRLYAVESSEERQNKLRAALGHRLRRS